MSGQPFRFLHAGGFRLDQPVSGLVEIPEPLIDSLIDAPFVAAQKVFDTAIEERVDFVALNGDLLDLSSASPRALTLLLDNFQRLDERGIAVYWACGRLDPAQDWPAAAALPGPGRIIPREKSAPTTTPRGPIRFASAMAISPVPVAISSARPPIGGSACATTALRQYWSIPKVIRRFIRS